MKPEDAKKFILEAWNEEKKSVAADIRSEMKTRYQEDLDRLTEGLDSLMKEVIKEIEALNLSNEEMDLFVQSKDGKCTGGCKHDCIVGTNTCDAQVTGWF